MPPNAGFRPRWRRRSEFVEHEGPDNIGQCKTANDAHRSRFCDRAAYECDDSSPQNPAVESKQGQPLG